MESAAQQPPNARPGKDELLALVYGELRILARQFIRNERRGHTLQATALVHEAYLRLAAQHKTQWRNEVHFLAIAAGVMRRVLVDYARAHQAEKRSGRHARLSLTSEFADTPHEKEIDLLALDGVLEKLNEIDPTQARIVELRFFGGLGVDQTADVIGLSSRTVDNEWALARAWLRRELGRGGAAIA